MPIRHDDRVYGDTIRLFLRGVGGYVVLVDKSPLYGTFEATVIPGITTPDPPAANGTLVYVRGPDNKIYYTRMY